MSPPRSRRTRLTRRESEHLLDGCGGNPDVARLLTDAARFDPRGPLRGEETALAAFRAAAHDLPPSPSLNNLPAERTGRGTSGAPPAIRPRPGRSASWGTALATLGTGSTVVVLSGFVLAAVGAVPEPWQVTAHHEASSVPSAGTDGGGSPPAGRDGSGGQAITPAGVGPAAPTRRDRYHTEWSALKECRLWWRGQEISGLPELREAAGGAEHVAEHCSRIAGRTCPPGRTCPYRVP